VARDGYTPIIPSDYGWSATLPVDVADARQFFALPDCRNCRRAANRLRRPASFRGRFHSSGGQRGGFHDREQRHTRGDCRFAFYLAARRRFNDDPSEPGRNIPLCGQREQCHLKRVSRGGQWQADEGSRITLRRRKLHRNADADRSQLIGNYSVRCGFSCQQCSACARRAAGDAQRSDPSGERHAGVAGARGCACNRGDLSAGLV
jgi:hypothetical protein